MDKLNLLPPSRGNRFRNSDKRVQPRLKGKSLARSVVVSLAVLGGVSLLGAETTYAVSHDESSKTTTVTAGDNISWNVYGNSADGTGIAEPSEEIADGYKVEMIGGMVNGEVFGGYADPGEGAAIATGNEVNISGGTVNNQVFGGYAYTGEGAATAIGNKVNISGGTVRSFNVEGGYAYTGEGTATPLAMR